MSNVQERIARKIIDFVDEKNGATAQEIRDYLELSNDTYLKNTLKLMIAKELLSYGDGILTSGKRPLKSWVSFSMMGKSKGGGVVNGKYLDRLPGGMTR